MRCAPTLARTHGATDTVTQGHGSLFDRTEQELTAARRDHLVRHLGNAEYERLTRQGNTLTLTEAVNITRALVEPPQLHTARPQGLPTGADSSGLPHEPVGATRQ